MRNKYKKEEEILSYSNHVNIQLINDHCSNFANLHILKMIGVSDFRILHPMWTNLIVKRKCWGKKQKRTRE